jgi:hypothetical protein
LQPGPIADAIKQTVKAKLTEYQPLVYDQKAAVKTG